MLLLFSIDNEVGRMHRLMFVMSLALEAEKAISAQWASCTQNGLYCKNVLFGFNLGLCIRV